MMATNLPSEPENTNDNQDLMVRADSFGDYADYYGEPAEIIEYLNEIDVLQATISRVLLEAAQAAEVRGQEPSTDFSQVPDAAPSYPIGNTVDLTNQSEVQYGAALTNVATDILQNQAGIAEENGLLGISHPQGGLKDLEGDYPQTGHEVAMEPSFVAEVPTVPPGLSQNPFAGEFPTEPPPAMDPFVDTVAGEQPPDLAATQAEPSNFGQSPPEPLDRVDTNETVFEPVVSTHPPPLPAVAKDDVWADFSIDGSRDTEAVAETLGYDSVDTDVFSDQPPVFLGGGDADLTDAAMGIDASIYPEEPDLPPAHNPLSVSDSKDGSDQGDSIEDQSTTTAETPAESPKNTQHSVAREFPPKLKIAVAKPVTPPATEDPFAAEDAPAQPTTVAAPPFDNKSNNNNNADENAVAIELEVAAEPQVITDVPAPSPIKATQPTAREFPSKLSISVASPVDTPTIDEPPIAAEPLIETPNSFENPDLPADDQDQETVEHTADIAIEEPVHHGDDDIGINVPNDEGSPPATFDVEDNFGGDAAPGFSIGDGDQIDFGGATAIDLDTPVTNTVEPSENFTVATEDGSLSQASVGVDVLNAEPVVEPAATSENVAKAEIVIALDLSALVPNDGNRDAYAVMISGLPEQTWLSAGDQDAERKWLINLVQLIGLTATIPAIPAVDEQLAGLIVEVINRNTRDVVQTAKFNDSSYDQKTNTVTMLP